ncbi:hypothetical protein SSX86_015068 [Deinandra increscens subsp. villosa]|uniref:Protein kinase domain-containing protein n=1 Tax=Deinandra increscens subsp. villosa TaxID=3103831 RepID=A0AAP0GYY1_9ASTR
MLSFSSSSSLPCETNQTNNYSIRTRNSSPLSMDSILSFSLIFLLIPLFIISTYSQFVPDHYFINCGSKSSTDFTGKTFTGDDNFSGGLTADNPTPNTPPIYQTARVFTQKSWYDLQADANNSFVMVRLHFSPFRYNGIELSDSKFHVSVSGFVLLSDFNTGAITSITRDFIVPIRSVTTFRIEFTPTDSSSPAFVNAVEAFTTPPELFRHGAPTPSVSATGENGEVNNVASSYAFVPVHRINVGGAAIELDRDTLRRNWTPDDPYIFRSEAAANRSFAGTPSYNGLGSSQFDAPDDVYKTAKILTSGFSVNLTWSFAVNTNAMYLVRAHFCYFMNPGLSDANAGFNFFVNGGYAQKIQPAEMKAVQVPFYVDIVVRSSVESGFVNVSIGAVRGDNQTAFLNGVEIMELVESSGAVDDRKDGKKRKNVYIVVIGCVIGGVMLVLVLLVGLFIGSRCRRAKPMVEVKAETNVVPSYGRSSYTSINVDFSINHASPMPNLNLSLRFQFADILQATNGFDEKLVVGKGGFGTVYRGTLSDGMIVAVKRGVKGHGQGRPEFVTEIMVLSKIRHRHLVTLIGYCDEQSEMILVYEFMERGTLQDHLYENKDHPKLSWNKRLDICISATRGLHYLHTGSDAGIIHRDVKSTNILLNEKYLAKVADFGISRLDNAEDTEISFIKGSFGYLDPEYIRCMKLTQKSDVYSFGVVLLEVLCARPALDNTLPQKEANLADWAIRNIKDRKAEAIMDPYLVGTINPNSLRKFLETVERCLKETGDERPSMIDVLWDLEYALKLQQMSGDKEPYEDSTMTTSLQLPMSMIRRLPSNANYDDDDSEVNVGHSVATNYPSDSQVFSQLNLDEAR